MHHPRALAASSVLILASLVSLTGCSDSRMALESDMKMEGTLRLEGPIQMQIQGPAMKYTGTYISENLLDRVKEKETRADWILAVFGEPEEKGKLNDGTEIWKWIYRPTMQDSSLVTLFGKDDEPPRPQQSATFLRMREGVVIEKWRD